MKSICLLFAVFVVSVLAEEKSFTLTPDEKTRLETPNYPDDAPANLDLTWKLTAPAGKKVMLECNDIRLFQNEPCGPWVMTITDGGKKEEICSSLFDFKKKSETNELTINVKTGNADRGFVACIARAA